MAIAPIVVLVAGDVAALSGSAATAWGHHQFEMTNRINGVAT